MSLKETNKYDDIIGLPHPTSKKHPRMAAIDRAAQFSPFAALTGYEKALEEIKETAIEKVANEIETEEWQDI
ncbi:MAG: hypothetical protein IJ420_05525 [Lachnospiraceae bacterium]|nr:hypothetical protein [Lachnospiraceae bacterium]